MVSSFFYVSLSALSILAVTGPAEIADRKLSALQLYDAQSDAPLLCARRFSRTNLYPLLLMVPGLMCLYGPFCFLIAFPASEVGAGGFVDFVRRHSADYYALLVLGLLVKAIHDDQTRTLVSRSTDKRHVYKSEREPSHTRLPQTTIRLGLPGHMIALRVHSDVIAAVVVFGLLCGWLSRGLLVFGMTSLLAYFNNSNPLATSLKGKVSFRRSCISHLVAIMAASTLVLVQVASDGGIWDWSDSSPEAPATERGLDDSDNVFGDPAILSALYSVSDIITAFAFGLACIPGVALALVVYRHDTKVHKVATVESPEAVTTDAEVKEGDVSSLYANDLDDHSRLPVRLSTIPTAALTAHELPVFTAALRGLSLLHIVTLLVAAFLSMPGGGEGTRSLFGVENLVPVVMLVLLSPLFIAVSALVAARHSSPGGALGLWRFSDQWAPPVQ